MPRQSIETRISPLFPSGICSAPPYFQDLFKQIYDTPQSALAERIDKILCEKGRIFLQQPPKTGEALQAFMCDLLATYKCTGDQERSKILSEINQYDNLKKNMLTSTIFSFCEMMSSVERPRRETINFITTHSIYNIAAQHDAKITVSEFCEDAQSFFGISLNYNDIIKDRDIASVRFVTDPRNDNNNVFLHIFSYLKLLGEGKEPLFFLYSQLLAVIFNIEKTPEENQGTYNKRRLNAIFLLVFLIGSNPPLFNDAGGGFVTDAMLQILLVSAGFTPIQKNFLSLTEIELLFAFKERTQQSWDSVQAHYLAACRGETNVLFHPQAAGARGFLHFLETPYYEKIIFSNEHHTLDYFQKKSNRSPLYNIKATQGSPFLRYKKCHASLKFTLQLFIDDFAFIDTAQKNIELLTVIENYFGLSTRNNGYLLRALLASDKLNEAQRESILDTIEKDKFKKIYVNDLLGKYDRAQRNIIALEIEYHFNHPDARIEQLELFLKKAISIASFEYALDVLDKSLVKDEKTKNFILEKVLSHQTKSNANIVHEILKYSPEHSSELIALTQTHETIRNIFSKILPMQDNEGSTTAHLLIQHYYEPDEFSNAIKLINQYENISKAFSAALSVRNNFGWSCIDQMAACMEFEKLIFLFELAKSNTIIRSSIASYLRLQNNFGERGLNTILDTSIDVIKSLLLLLTDQSILLAFGYSFMQLNEIACEYDAVEEKRKFLQSFPFYFMLLTHFNNFYIAHTAHLLLSNPNNKLLQKVNQALKIPGFFINVIEHKINFSKEILKLLRILIKIPTNPIILSEPPTFVSPVYRFFSSHQPKTLDGLSLTKATTDKKRTKNT